VSAPSLERHLSTDTSRMRGMLEFVAQTAARSDSHCTPAGLRKDKIVRRRGAPWDGSAGQGWATQVRSHPHNQSVICRNVLVLLSTLELLSVLTACIRLCTHTITHTHTTQQCTFEVEGFGRLQSGLAVPSFLFDCTGK